MIFTDRTIIVQKGISSINDTIILYRGDKGVEIRFTLNEGSPFRFGSGASPNIIEKTEAAYGQLVIKTPNDLPSIFSEIAPTNEGKIVFTITAEMIDEIAEVGNYTFQIRLLDESRNSRATLPEVVNGIEIREPIDSEDASNEVNVATVGYALTTAGVPEDAFDSEGNYNKTTWATRDRITASKLNKIENGIYDAHNKINVINNKVEENTTNTNTARQDISDIKLQIGTEELTTTSKKIKGAINDLSSQIKEKANKNEIFSMANMGQDVKEAMTGGSVAVVGKNTILNENIVDRQIEYEKLEFVESVVKKNLFKSGMKLDNNKCWKASDGTETTISGYYGTVKIKTEGNLSVYALSPKQVIFWDAGGNYLSFLKESQFTFIRNIDRQSVMKITIPANAYYFGINFENALSIPVISFMDFEAVADYGYSKIVINEENKKIIKDALGIADNNNKYKDLKMNCMGDSITYGYTPGSGAQMDRPYPLILKELLGLSECRNYGISGSRLIGDSHNPVISRYSNMNDDADIISIFIGTNDYEGNNGGNWGSDLGTINDSDNTSFYGALNILCDGLLTKYPDKFIFFITPLHREGDLLPNARGCYLKDYVNAIKEVCEKFGIPVLDFYSKAGFNANNSTQKTLLIPDGLHPNQLCQEKKVAPQIANFIKNNYI